MLRIRSLIVLGAVAAGSCAFAAPQAMAASSAPRAVVCLAPATGAQGATGPQGWTGPVGDTAPQGNPGAAGAQGDTGTTSAGAPRSVHVAGLNPNCADLPLLCVVTSQGAPGAVGPTGAKGDTGFEGLQGASGPKGDTGDTGVIPGAPRRVHPAGGVPRCPAGDSCRYSVEGPSGLVGPAGSKGDIGAMGTIGDTGAQGPKGDTGVGSINGPSRVAHGSRVSGDFYHEGETVTLPECALPETGGRSTPLLPFGIGLAAFGAAVAWYTRRRKVAPTA